MALARVCHKLPSCCLAFAVVLGVCVAPAVAQQAHKPHASPAPRTIILPSRVVAGAPATLAVFDFQGRLLPKIEVELSGGQKVLTDATGRAAFVAPNQLGTLAATVSGHAVSASAAIVPAGDAGPKAVPGQSPGEPTERAPGPATVLSYPHIVNVHDRFTLEGAGFRGAADSNHIYLNDDPCLIVASSPVSLVALPGPGVPVGDVNLHVTVGGVDAGQFLVSAVLLEISGPAEAVDAGSSGQLVVHVHGTAKPLAVEVRNLAPGVIQLSNGNVERLKTSGGEENFAPVAVKFVTGGNYAVLASLLSTAASPPDLESARRRLIEARNIASAEWSVRIDQVLLNLDRTPQDVQQIRAELKSILDDKPAAPLASLLNSAWRELN